MIREEKDLYFCEICGVETYNYNSEPFGDNRRWLCDSCDEDDTKTRNPISNSKKKERIMKLNTYNYTGATVSEVMRSLRSDRAVMDFIRAHNLRGGDVLEAIATAMVVTDPTTVDVHSDGAVTTTSDDAR